MNRKEIEADYYSRLADHDKALHDSADPKDDTPDYTTCPACEKLRTMDEMKPCEGCGEEDWCKACMETHIEHPGVYFHPDCLPDKEEG